MIIFAIASNMQIFKSYRGCERPQDYNRAIKTLLRCLLSIRCMFLLRTTCSGSHMAYTLLMKAGGLRYTLQYSLDECLRFKQGGKIKTFIKWEQEKLSSIV